MFIEIKCFTHLKFVKVLGFKLPIGQEPLQTLDKVLAHSLR